MAIEIERKFLIHPDKLPALGQGCPMRQGYIPTLNGTTVRVRIEGEQAFLCIKTRATNLTRQEYQFGIPVNDAREMLEKVCDPAQVEKVRYLITHAGMTWEIDVFSGANQGLIVAEIELLAENQEFALPDWVANEVTHDPRYSNYSLAMNPSSAW